jgi:hypothetical protein
VQTNIILSTIIILAGACAPAEDPASVPAPIGDELMRFSTALGVPGCERGHLYRARRSLQLQCLAVDGSFSWENRGILSAEGEATLTAAIGAVDLQNTNPAEDYDHLCKGSESGAATVTLWMGDESFSYSPVCPTEGIAPLHEAVTTIFADIGNCGENAPLELLESVEPGCRPY